jgi:hypothetical protein
MTTWVVGLNLRGGRKIERHQYVPQNGSDSEPSWFRKSSLHAGCRRL